MSTHRTGQYDSPDLLPFGTSKNLLLSSELGRMPPAGSAGDCKAQNNGACARPQNKNLRLDRSILGWVNTGEFELKITKLTIAENLSVFEQ